MTKHKAHCTKCGRVWTPAAQRFAARMQAARERRKREAEEREAERRKRVRAADRLAFFARCVPDLYFTDRERWSAVQDFANAHHEVIDGKTRCGLAAATCRRLGVQLLEWAPAAAPAPDCKACAAFAVHAAAEILYSCERTASEAVRAHGLEL